MSRVVYLKELIEIKNGKDYRKLEKGKIPVYGTGGVITYVNDFLYDGESILLPRKGSLNNIMYVDNDKFWTVDTMYWSIVKKEKVYPKYLFCYLSLLNLSSRDTGSTLPSMTFDSYYTLPIKLYDYEIQKKIGDLYFKLTQKIELNNKINSELEAMAKTIYDYWFLQFEFPNEDGKPYKSSGGKMVWNDELKREIPGGWEVKKVKDFLEVITGKEDANHATIKGIYPFFTCSNDVLRCDDYKFEGKAILIAGNGDFNIKYYEGKFNAYQRTYVLIPNKDESVGLIYLSSLKTLQKFKAGANGSIVKFITKSDIENINVYDSKNQIDISIFNKILDDIIKNRKENQELISLRDFLLPLLMNGQVGFKEENN